MTTTHFSQETFQSILQLNFPILFNFKWRAMSSMTHLSKTRLNLFHQIFEYDSTFKLKVVCMSSMPLRVFHLESFFQYDSTFKW
jgi:hypothetical protein